MALSAIAPAWANDKVVLGGGSPIVIGGRTACTLTAIGHDRSGDAGAPVVFGSKLVGVGDGFTLQPA